MSSNVLSLTGIHKSYGTRTLITDLSLGINAGEKVGIIGANGAGKSTLLKLIAGREAPDRGRIAIRGGSRVAFVEQLPSLPPDATVAQVLDSSFADLKACIAEYEVAATEGRDDASDLLDRIQHLGGWDYEHKLEKAAMEVGLTAMDARVKTLSGGESKRLALAQLILQEPDIVLLDEPTNHLDANTVEWLEEWLAKSSATVILVTHDRYFLDDVVDRLVELRDGELRSYAGNYTDFLAARAVEEAHRDRIHHRRLQILRSELDWARRSPKARTTKQQARLDRLDDVQEEVTKLTGKPFVAEFAFGAPPRLGSTILELDHVSMSYPSGPPLIKDLTLKMRAGERIGILGTNGSGKSTLLKLITGKLQPTKGKVTLGLNTSIAYFDQGRTAIDDRLTLRQTLTPGGGDLVYPGGGDPLHVASWLDRFGFSTPSHDRPVGTLSGGERNRITIALFLLQPANLLIFDEPTNDLDITTLHVLEEAIVGFRGCVLIVTHDRYLLDKVATSIVAFERELLGPGVVTCMEGSYTHYHDLRLRALKAAALEAQRAASQRERAHKVPAAVAPVAKKKLTFAERKELAEMEGAIESAERIVSELQGRLADPELWKRESEQARGLQRDLEGAQSHAAALYKRWEYLLANSDQAET